MGQTYTHLQKQKNTPTEVPTPAHTAAHARPQAHTQSTSYTEPQYLNLAHQFLDTNFIEATRRNRFNVLPVLSTSSVHESFVQTEPPLAVDYFSHDLTSKQYHNCWKSIVNNQFMKQYELSNVDNITRLRLVQQTDDLMMFLPTTSQPRLENACWRAWYKKLKSLKELDPTKINWFKENDVTVLYGPLIDDDEDITPASSVSASTVIDDSTAMLFDTEGDCKMSDWSPASPSSMDEEAISSDNDSLMFQRRYSVESTLTSFSSDSAINDTDVNTTSTESLAPKITLSITGTSTNTSTSNGKSSNSNTEITSNGTPGLRSILKRRKRVCAKDSVAECTKKRISFSQELISVRLIV